MSMWLGEPGVEKEFEQLPRKEGRQGQPRERLQTNRRIFSKYFFKIVLERVCGSLLVIGLFVQLRCHLVTAVGLFSLSLSLSLSLSVFLLLPLSLSIQYTVISFF
ncbi:Uncharacterized protein BM_BM10234 [Brugia malayi]|uniref:Bm10234 n=1 Tax=Brugia malayi TaxID=6279 RepID=A0A4E9FKB2_BRUMA|nr:Uncharacterized protein BM_BM10234 [Brugia malayi]VIO97395.1 Uncharacterized protein BM_BM10234 [Brugia malayi]